MGVACYARMIIQNIFKYEIYNYIAGDNDIIPDINNISGFRSVFNP
jgi:hypothetical protein